jgi:hypothetical protein
LRQRRGSCRPQAPLSWELLLAAKSFQLAQRFQAAVGGVVGRVRPCLPPATGWWALLMEAAALLWVVVVCTARAVWCMVHWSPAAVCLRAWWWCVARSAGVLLVWR